jgi:hypothetical protein
MAGLVPGITSSKNNNSTTRSDENPTVVYKILVLFVLRYASSDAAIKNVDIAMLATCNDMKYIK